MVTVGGQPGHSALDAALDVFRIRQYFDVIVRARDAATAIRKDATFLDRSGAGPCRCRSTAGLRRGTSSGRCAALSPRRWRAASASWRPVAAAPSRRSSA
jgi:hypothetical protein